MPYKCQSCGSKTANLKYCDSCIIRYNFSNDDAKAEEAQKIDDNTITFEKKWFDRAIPLRFKINYWLLKKLGLFGFGLFAFIIGFLVSVIIHLYIVPFLK